MTTTTAPAPSTCTCEETPPHHLDSHQPLTHRRDLDRRVRQLIPCALVRQVWLLLLDDDGVQMPLMIPIGELPDRPEGPKGSRGELRPEGLDEMLASLHKEFGVASFVFIMERPGGRVLDEADVDWLRALLVPPRRARYSMRAAYLVHDAGPWGFEPDELDDIVVGHRVGAVLAECRGDCDPGAGEMLGGPDGSAGSDGCEDPDGRDYPDNSDGRDYPDDRDRPSDRDRPGYADDRDRPSYLDDRGGPDYPDDRGGLRGRKGRKGQDDRDGLGGRKGRDGWGGSGASGRDAHEDARGADYQEGPDA